MAVVVCPWCQSEIPHEEGEELERYCPFCENELGGYRTLTIGGEEDDEEAEDDDGDEEDIVRSILGDEDLSWIDGEDALLPSETLLQVEEAVDKLLDEQEIVPECPHCKEYMLEAGAQVVTADAFLPRVPESLGQSVLEAPFSLTIYVCPSCFSVQHVLDEAARTRLASRLSGSGEGN